jgi:hypothetical protein
MDRSILFNPKLPVDEKVFFPFDVSTKGNSTMSFNPELINPPINSDIPPHG